MSDKEKKTALLFDSLSISRQQFGAHAGKLTCNVRASGYNTQLDVAVPEDITADIMNLIGPVIAAQVAKSLTSVTEDHLLISATQDKPVIEADATTSGDT